MTINEAADPLRQTAQPCGATESDAGFVRRAYEAVHKGQLHLLSEFFGEDFVLILPPSHPFAGEYHGLAEAGACLAQTFHAVGMERSEVRQIAADGRGSVFVVFEMIWADGSSMSLLEWVRIDQHMITEIRPFSWDSDLLRERAGSRRATS